MKPSHFRKLDEKCCDSCIHATDDIPNGYPESDTEEDVATLFCSKHEFCMQYSIVIPAGIDAYLCDDFSPNEQLQTLSVDSTKVS